MSTLINAFHDFLLDNHSVLIVLRLIVILEIVHRDGIPVDLPALVVLISHAYGVSLAFKFSFFKASPRHIVELLIDVIEA